EVDAPEGGLGEAERGLLVERAAGDGEGERALWRGGVHAQVERAATERADGRAAGDLLLAVARALEGEPEVERERLRVGPGAGDVERAAEVARLGGVAGERGEVEVADGAACVVRERVGEGTGGAAGAEAAGLGEVRVHVEGEEAAVEPRAEVCGGDGERVVPRVAEARVERERHRLRVGAGAREREG